MNNEAMQHMEVAEQVFREADELTKLIESRYAMIEQVMRQLSTETLKSCLTSLRKELKTRGIRT